jgi:hypothetical protein
MRENASIVYSPAVLLEARTTKLVRLIMASYITYILMMNFAFAQTDIANAVKYFY